jgi:(p)ppGpp synthase/HD superfamily hydrolase
MKSILTSRFEEALVFATRLHATQLRKGTTIPYIAHLLGATNLVINHGGDEDEAIAALLHDSVEDRGGRPTLEKVRASFGDKVAAIVKAVRTPMRYPNRHLNHARNDT